MDLIKINDDQIICILTEQDEKYFKYNNEDEKYQCIKQFISEVKNRAYHELDFDIINEPYSVYSPKHQTPHFIFTKKLGHNKIIYYEEWINRKR